MRIIAGKYRRRSIDPPPRGSREIRPTHDRIRENVFNLIGDRVEGARFLDLFAGTGIVGLEAISRGAKEAWFIDQSRPAVEKIKQNCDKFGVRQSCVVRCDNAFRFLKSRRENDPPFDLIYIDPPYDSNQTLRAVESVAKKFLLRGDGIAITEYNMELCSDPELELTLADQRRYGAIWVGLWRWRGTEEGAEGGQEI